MDTREVSQDTQIAAALRNAQLMYESSKRRNGQLVHYHPSPQSIIAKFLAMNRGLEETHSSGHTISMTQLPPPYLPSDRFLDELQPIRITQMRLGEHHRSTKVFLRVLTPPNRINAMLAAVEDLEGTTVTLQLYHQPPEATNPSKETIQVGRVLLLKEPFFKCATDGTYSLRVDHLGDVVWLEPCDGRIPDIWKTTAPKMSSEAVRMQGNEAVKKACWAKALRLYSDAVRCAATPEEAQLAFVNRSLTNLRLGRPEQALIDANKTNEQISPTEKSTFREIRALYELRYFDRCLERLTHFLENWPDNSEAKAEMARVKTRTSEKNDGAYSFSRMYRQANQSTAQIDCATFSVPVEVRDAPGRGRGLFTTKAVRAGDLLLCEKAFVYSYCDLSSGRYSVLMDLESKRGFAGAQAEILTQMIQNLYHNPEYSRPILNLHHGDYKTVGRDVADGNPVVDSFLAAKIMSLNVFGAPRTSRETLSNLLKDKKDADGGKGGFGTAGIWIKASYVNHSCVGNCRRSFIGDMQILRAAADMEAGTELLFPYHQPQELDSHDDMQRRLKHWGFTCTCALCQAKRPMSAAQLSKRKLLMKSMQGIIDLRANKPLAKGLRLLDELNETYPESYPAELPRLEICSTCFAMAMKYNQRSDLRKTVEMLLQGLQALGYKITSVWPLSDRVAAGASRAQFEIKKWGLANDMVPWALVNLYGASKSMAPSLSQRIREYAQRAYSIVVGEGDTFLQTFPAAV
ncbi:TPR domain protein [Akanthomyces lecanii RCEF 1005]|uniref:TPR domain protein n=1 Tax=Akanthomyces lecanii RCEF 1005 TaxID=1081108 RepID=A0A168HZU3_CORDF|nr:TPR domain protein [Akanthomyces lecanii RCEF 1005]